MEQNDPPIDRAVSEPSRPQRRLRAALKGRQVDPAARERVDRLCADLEPSADLLIEHLHRIQDAEGGLRKGLLAALAGRLRLSQAEVHEVASFYHHFDVVDDAAELPATTVRVCTSLSCAMAGGESLLADLRQRLAGEKTVRVVEAPCIGQCHRAPQDRDCGRARLLPCHRPDRHRPLYPDLQRRHCLAQERRCLRILADGQPV